MINRYRGKGNRKRRGEREGNKTNLRKGIPQEVYEL